MAKDSGIEPGPLGEVFDSLCRTAELDLYGGLAVLDGERLIRPGCCSGLYDWREWVEGLRTGDSPWMGHDPAPRVEWGEAVVRVWSDGGVGPAPEAFAIDLGRGEVAEQLVRVAAELRAFARRLGEWSGGYGCSDPAALTRRFIERFAPP